MEWEFLCDCAFSWSLPTCTFLSKEPNSGMFNAEFDTDDTIHKVALFGIEEEMTRFIKSHCLGLS